MLPDVCYADYPATIVSGNDEATVIVLQSSAGYLFRISDCYLEWNKIRLLWIAFYKNRNNYYCPVAKLPKDLIFHIIKFIGKLKLDETNEKCCIKL